MSTFEDELQWKGSIDRFDVACGFYGDCQWQVWKDDGEYVEFSDHQAIVNIYSAEVARLKRIVEGGYHEV